MGFVVALQLNKFLISCGKKLRGSENKDNNSIAPFNNKTAVESERVNINHFEKLRQPRMLTAVCVLYGAHQ